MEIRRVELLASAVQKQRSTTELYPLWITANYTLPYGLADKPGLYWT